MGYGTVFCVKMGQARWPWNVMVCLVLGVGVKPMIGLERLGIDPPALKNLLIAYVGGLFGRFVVMAVIYFVLAIVLGVLVSRHKKHRA